MATDWRSNSFFLPTFLFPPHLKSEQRARNTITPPLQHKPAPLNYAKRPFNKHSRHKRVGLFRHVSCIFPLFSFLHTTPRDKPPEQVSSYQVAPTFCNKSIPSNPKLQLNFLNTELVKPGIRRRGEEGEKFCSFSRQDWERGSAGMLSVLIKR